MRIHSLACMPMHNNLRLVGLQSSPPWRYALIGLASAHGTPACAYWNLEVIYSTLLLTVPLSLIHLYFMVDTDVLSLTIESGVLYPPIVSLDCDH